MKTYVYSGADCIEFNAESSVIEQLRDFMFLKQYIPDGRLTDTPPLTPARCVLNFETSDELHFSLVNDTGVLKGTLGVHISLHDIVTVIDYILELSRQYSGRYCMHGSAVAKEGKGLYIMGSVSGLGKTTLALNLALQRKFEFIGDEKLIIDAKGFVLSGVKHVTFNKPALFISVSENMDGKTPEELSSLMTFCTQPVPVAYVIQPVIVVGGELSIEIWDKQKSEFHMYEEMSRKIRGISRRISNFTIPLPSIDTQENSEVRSRVSKLYADQAQFLMIQGDASVVLDAVEDLFR